jgi:ketosteroid isomerase-like protein
MSRDVTNTFADIDSMEPDRFVEHLTPDVTFRFANGDPVVGRAAVRDAVAGFFTTISGMKHNLLQTWDVDDTTIVQVDVEYTRTDGKVVTVPNVDILKFDGGGLVRDWQIYIDLAPVFA